MFVFGTFFGLGMPLAQEEEANKPQEITVGEADSSPEIDRQSKSESDSSQNAVDLSVLPSVSDGAALTIPHFPGKMYAFIWRNWNLIETERLARVLQTEASNVEEIARLMGLPAYRPPHWSINQIYITLLRRNWHILPYEQLLTLLDFTPEQLAFKLREDDFLWVKLGQIKPLCPPVLYAPPTEADLARLTQIRQTVSDNFGDSLNNPGEDRFAFLAEFSLPSQTPLGASSEISASSPQKSRLELRFIYSYFALFGDPLLHDSSALYPDGLLERLSQSGVNGVWLHVVLRDVTPGTAEFPEFGQDWEIRQRHLQELVDRAKKYGIDVYLYMNEPRAMPNAFFEKHPEIRGVQEGDFSAMCVSSDAVQQWLGDSLAHLFQHVSGLGGIFTISGSENLTTCVSHGQAAKCPRCAAHTDAELIAQVNAIMEEGVHRSAPDANVLVWDWGWRGHAIAPEIIEQLPKNVWLMSVSEWDLPLNRGGISTKVNEYSLSAVGPGPRATAHWDAAQRAGLKTAAKVQLNSTWEIASVPYVPVMDLVAEHCHRLAQSGVNGLMMSWSLGCYPSMNLTIPRQFDRDPLPSVDEVLDELALSLYGEAGASDARKGWTLLSQAYQEFPYHVSVMYCAPTQIGPANLLRMTPSNYPATMVGLPYDDLMAWSFPFPPEIFANQFEKVSRGFAQGTQWLKQAADQAAPDKQAEAQAQIRYADVVAINFQSVANQTRFILLRNELLQSETPTARKQEIRQLMVPLIESEIDLAEALFARCNEDSRIGFESTNHYWFVPQDLVEKVISCQFQLDELSAAD